MSAHDRTVFCTDSVLGRFGLGGPGLHTAAALLRDQPAGRVIARAADPATGLDAMRCTIVGKARWRQALEGTRLHAVQARTAEYDRIDFDRRVAAVLPSAALVVGENSTSLETFRRARTLGSACVLMQHNVPFARMRDDLIQERETWGGPEPFITERLVDRCAEELRLATGVIAFSDLVAEELVLAGQAPERVRKAAFGVDCARFRPRAEPQSDAGLTVAFVGWLNRWKGYPYLVEGFRDAALPGSRLLLHGGTSRAHPHELVARLRGTADVGVVRGPVEETFAVADVCVLPSVADGYGLAALEAMACRLPVIVTDRCGVAQDVDDGVSGFVVPARDSAAIRDALIRLADPELRASMGRAARATAERLTWAAYEARITELLRASTWIR